jgi:hypothetical protein
MLGGRRRRCEISHGVERIRGVRDAIEQSCRRRRPDAGKSWITRKPATRSRGFSAQRRNASTSFTCAASRNLRPPNFTNGMLRRASSISSKAL